MNREAEFLIKELRLEKHEEGGYYRCTYESRHRVELPGYSGFRHIGTAIYYLILGDAPNPFHRLKSDEIWHFYCGSPLVLYTIDPIGKLSKIRMGTDIRKEQSVQVVLDTGIWFGAEVDDKSSYSLVGCTVSPGFDPSDFEFGKKKLLIEEYPEHSSLIERLAQP